MPRKDDIYRNLLRKDMPAALWKRVVAYILDMFIVSFIILSPLKNGLVVSADKGINEFYSYMAGNPGLAKGLFVAVFFSSLIVLLYWSVLDYLNGATIGKMLMRLKVISGTKRLTFAQTFVRNLTKMNTTFLLLDAMYMVFKRTHLRYFEKITNTEVVESWAR